MKKNKIYKMDCLYFGGYKPCKPYKLCKGCKEYKKIGKKILIINLDALGDVLKTTSLLPALKRKYSDSHITWITDIPAEPLLANNPHINKVCTFKLDDILPLLCQSFDVLYNGDKTRRSCALANMARAKKKFGFGLDDNGVIVPMNDEAQELYAVGLNDELKFFKNKRSNQELLGRAWDLDYKRDEYVLNLDDEEKEFIANFRKENGLKKNDFVIGVNTGSSKNYPYKRIAIDLQINLIKKLKKLIPQAKIALLGGKEDIGRNEKIKKALKGKVINTPCDMGLRKGILFIAACDMMITGDTVALHIAIALKKPVVVWFSITCENEIDLYGRGLKVISRVECRPCWKSYCDKEIKCNEVADTGQLSEAAFTLYKRYGKK